MGLEEHTSQQYLHCAVRKSKNDSPPKYATAPDMQVGPLTMVQLVGTDPESAREDIRHHSSRPEFFSYRTKDLQNKAGVNSPICILNISGEKTMSGLARNPLINLTAERFITDGDDLQVQIQNPFTVQYVFDPGKYVWIIADGEKLHDATYASTIKQLCETRAQAMAELTLPVKAFGINLMVLVKSFSGRQQKLMKFDDNLEKRGAFALHNITDHSPDYVEKFIISQYDSRTDKVSNMLTAHHTGALCEVQFQLKPNDTDHIGPSNEEYFRQAYKVLHDKLDDANGSFRQELQRVYQLPNVRIVEMMPGKDNRFDTDLIAEIRLLSFGGYLTFENAVHGGTLAVSLEDTMRVRGQPLNGHVEVTILTPLVKTQASFESPQDDIVNCLSVHRVLALKTLLVTKLYEQCINDSSKLPYDFIEILRKLGSMALIDSVRTPKGENAMHLAIRAARPDFLLMIFYLDRWGLYRSQITDIPRIGSTLPPLAGYTPRRLGEAYAHKAKGQTILNEYDRLDSVYINMTPLQRASLQGRLEFVKVLVTSKLSSKHAKNRDMSDAVEALMHACGSGHYKVVLYWMSQGVRPGREDQGAHLAAMFGHRRVLKVLFKHVIDVVGKPNKDGFTPVDYCCMNGDLEALKMFCDRNIKMGSQALAIAVKYQRDEVVTSIQECCTVDINSHPDHEGQLPIHHAAMSCNFSIVEKLIALNADLTRTDKYGRNLLHFCAEHNNKDLLTELLPYLQCQEILATLINAKDFYTGKSERYVVRGRDRGRRAWHWLKLHRLGVCLFKKAISGGQLDVADFGNIMFSGFGVNPDQTVNKEMAHAEEELLKPENRSEDMTPLNVAAYRGHYDVVKLFLEYGAEPNLTDHFGSSPAHFAAMSGNLQMMVALDEGGADLNLLNDAGETCGQVAEKNGHLDVVNYVDAKSTIHRTEAVHRALEKVKAALNEDVLLQQRHQGRDVKRLIIEALRELTIDVNVLLQEMGSGPIHEATSDN